MKSSKLMEADNFTKFPQMDHVQQIWGHTDINQMVIFGNQMFLILTPKRQERQSMRTASIIVRILSEDMK